MPQVRLGDVAVTARRHPRITVVVAAYLVDFTIYGLVTGASLTIPYALIVGTAVVAIGIADVRVRFSTLVLVGLAVWGAGHMAGGIVQLDGDRILYNAVILRWFHFDNIVHFIGFGTAGIACWEASGRTLPAGGTPLGTATMVWLFAMGVGALNEVVEFGATHAFTTQVGGYENTGRDLVANMLGAAVGGWLVARRVRSGVSEAPATSG